MMYSAAVLGFNQSLGRSVREWTNLETSLAAISRVKTFSETTASERDYGVTNTTPSLWPSGNIVLKNQSASYNGDEMPPVLNDISFEVSAGQEIGICGRQSCLWMECYSTPVDTPVLDSSGVDSSRGWSGVE